MPCAHRKVDGSQHWTTPRRGTLIRVVEEEAELAIFGGGCQRERRPKTYRQAAGPRRPLSQQAYIIQVVGTTTICCCSSQLLPPVADAACCCIAVTRAPLRTTRHHPGRRKNNFITRYHYGRQSTHRWGLNMRTNHSLHFKLTINST